MKRMLFLIAIMALILTAPFPVFSGKAQPASRPGDHQIFIPVVNRIDPQRTTIQQIAMDVAAGRITAEQGLIYQVFATFSDPRLPQEYHGGKIGEDGDGVMMDAASRWDSLSTGAQDTIRPFLIPPDQPGSWFNLTPHGAAQDLQPQAFWSSALSQNGKVRFYWPTGSAAGQAKAAGLKAAMDQKIWTNLTTYMGKTPIMGVNGTLNVYAWDSYDDGDGNIVPFDPNEGGVTVRPSCALAAGTIYIPISRPLGNELSPGSIQSLAHEFMHTLQYSYNAQGDCATYKWLREGTAKWAEDYVYHLANSEHPRAIDYLSKPNLRLDDPSTNTRYYGTWVLPYYLTHKLSGASNAVRRIWEEAEKTDNSFMALYQAPPTALKDYFWGMYLTELWNLTPYDEYYKKDDGLLDSVAAETPDPIPVTLTGGYFSRQLNDNMKTGAARFYHFTFTDSSVRNFTILNGIGMKLTKTDAEAWGNWDVTTGDQVYQTEDLTPDQMKGATLVVLLKAAGLTWQPYIFSYSDFQFGSFSYCFDSQTKIDEMVVVQSNADWEHPDRELTHLGEPTTVVASNIPCWKLQGTSKVTFYTHTAEGEGITKSYSANVTYGKPSAIPDPTAYLNNVLVYPEVSLTLISADVNWTVSGSDGKCTYSGNGSYHVNESPGAGSRYVYLYSGILPGSPSYRGYQGQGTQDESVKITYTISGKDCPGSTEEGAAWYLEIPIIDDRGNIKVPAGGGALSGSYKRNGASAGDYTLLEWNLSPQKK